MIFAEVAVVPFIGRVLVEEQCVVFAVICVIRLSFKPVIIPVRGEEEVLSIRDTCLYSSLRKTRKRVLNTKRNPEMPPKPDISESSAFLFFKFAVVAGIKTFGGAVIFDGTVADVKVGEFGHPIHNRDISDAGLGEDQCVHIYSICERIDIRY